MPSSKQIPRCHHINTAGVQCNSPALTKHQFCYYHMQGRSTSIKYYSEAPYCAIEEDLPLFEDAHSIQIAIRQVASLLIQNKIEHKTASLLLYSLQLALMNLRMLQAEKPQPAQLAVDVEKCEETMPEPTLETNPAPSQEEPKTRLTAAERKAQKDEAHEAEVEKQLEYLLFIGRHLEDPADTVVEEEEYHRLKDAIRRIPGNSNGPPEHELEELRKRFPPSSEPKLPPGSIQACVAKPQPRRLRKAAD